MKAQTRTKLALFGGAAALVLAVGGGGIASASSTTTTAGTTIPAATVTPAPPTPGVHIATLASFYVPRTCVPEPCPRP
jgi:hypothetical protein